MVSQVVGEPLEPEVIRKEPAISVEPLATAAVGPVPLPQLDGVPIVGGLVWEDFRWALVKVRLAKVEVVPATVMVKLEVLAVNRLVPEAFWICRAVDESVWFLNSPDPPTTSSLSTDRESPRSVEPLTCKEPTKLAEAAVRLPPLLPVSAKLDPPSPTRSTEPPSNILWVEV